MSKTVSLRIDDKLYNALKVHAEAENRSISNFLETAALKYIEEVDYIDDFEMLEINNNDDLVRRLKRGISDARNSRGDFV